MAKPENYVDPAALAGATLAVVVAVLLGEGPYNWMSGAIGTTLLLIAWVYRPPTKDSAVKRLMFATVVGLSSTPLIGLFLELTLGHGSLPTGKESLVTPTQTAIGWLLISGLAFFAAKR